MKNTPFTDKHLALGAKMAEFAGYNMPISYTGINDETLFCLEYTGIYNTGLINFLVHHSAAIWVEMPLRIKRAAGLESGLPCAV